MSAQGRPALTEAELKAKQSQTKIEKLKEVGGARVTKLLSAMQSVGRLGRLIKEAEKEGINGEQVVQQIQAAIAAEFKTISEQLRTGEAPESAFTINV